MYSDNMSDSDSDASSIIDPDSVGVENDVDDEWVEEDPFGSEEEDDNSEETYMSKCGNIRWSSQRPDTVKNKPELANGERKFNVDFAKIKTPLDAFVLFLDDSIVNMICQFTNAEGSHDPDFRIVDRNALLAWIGVLLAAGKNHDSKTHITELWSSDDVTNRVFYSAVMSRTRFV